MAVGDTQLQLVTFQLGQELYGVDIMANRVRPSLELSLMLVSSEGTPYTAHRVVWSLATLFLRA